MSHFLDSPLHKSALLIVIDRGSRSDASTSALRLVVRVTSRQSTLLHTDGQMVPHSAPAGPRAVNCLRPYLYGDSP
jgi:hypothetical protein